MWILNDRLSKRIFYCKLVKCQHSASGRRKRFKDLSKRNRKKCGSDYSHWGKTISDRLLEKAIIIKGIYSFDKNGLDKIEKNGSRLKNANISRSLFVVILEE